MRHYIAIIHKDGKSDFGVSFPDFPGCISAGRTLKEATEMAVEALEGHIELMVDTGQPIPEPSDIGAVKADPNSRDGFAALIPAPDPTKARAVRLSVTLPKGLLKEIDAFAERQGYTRSGLLAHAAKHMIEDAPAKRAASSRQSRPLRK